MGIIPQCYRAYNMANITIFLDDDLLASVQRYAKDHDTLLNALIRQLIEKNMRPDRQNWLATSFRLMDRADINSGGKEWNVRNGRFNAISPNQ